MSDEPIPDEMLKYVSGWKEKLPGYEFRLWNFDRFDINESAWVREAFQAGKFAFAADYIRLYAIYHHGGIYMDMDVEVIKPFDDLLGSDYILGYELRHNIEGGIIGAAKGDGKIKECLDYYSGRHFIKPDGSYDMRSLPNILDSILSKYVRDAQLFPFPPEYLTAKSLVTGRINITPNTYTVHHFAGSWTKRSFKKKVKKRVRSFFPDAWLLKYNDWKHRARREQDKVRLNSVEPLTFLKRAFTRKRNTKF